MVNPDEIQLARNAVVRLGQQIVELEDDLAAVEQELKAAPASTKEAEIKRVTPLMPRQFALTNLLGAAKNELSIAQAEVARLEEDERHRQANVLDAEAKTKFDEVSSMLLRAGNLALECIHLCQDASTLRREMASAQAWHQSQRVVSVLKNLGGAAGFAFYSDMLGKQQFKKLE